MPPRPFVSPRPAVVQGNFRGQVPAFVLQARPGVAQPARRGHAFEVPASVSVSATGPGQTLPAAVQQKMEALFGSSFADVRVHVGPQASAIGALAFTMGTDLFFAPGQYDPHSPHGQRLLGHELAHVVQQRAGRVRNPFGRGVAVVQDPGLEAEAERMGLRTAAALPSAPVQPRAGGPPPPGGRVAMRSPAPGADDVADWVDLLDALLAEGSAEEEALLAEYEADDGGAEAPASSIQARLQGG